MQTLILDLLTYSRLTRVPLERERVDLEQCLAGTLSDVESLIQQSGASRTIRCRRSRPARFR